MQTWVKILIVVIILALLGVGGYFLYEYLYKKSNPSGPPPTPPSPTQPSPTSPNPTPPSPISPSPPTASNVVTPCPTYSSIYSVDIPGFDMSNGYSGNQTEEQCKALCESRNCNWMNFSVNSGDCWLKQGVSKPDLVTGFRIQDNPSGSSCPQYSITNGMDIPGFDMPGSPHTNVSQQDCQNLCNNNNCDWYNYQTSTSNCWLKKGNSSKPNIETIFKVTTS
ncbi:hypothetical protein QJ857_gp0572 [Tupanvirus soda lake]|uniref:Apple domain-containing protein n=2 Tax=Tupanvirus TaxID=2094720 RepID=A0A6N1P393_9VIRU|nr:hypothetical protein QJ857_gp0572 [Tupanvirus soda lake]QKU35471.1 hypothetical protein [Tupanvirus soda lake]